MLKLKNRNELPWIPELPVGSIIPRDPSAVDRWLSSAWHPSARGPVPHLVDVETPYMPLDAPADAVWPRATIRVLPLMRGHGIWYAAKIWDAPGVPAYVDASYGIPVEDGCWVSSNFEHLAAAVDWAVAEVERRRPKANPDGPLESPC